MKLMILPGFSLNNKKWSQEVSEYLTNDFDVYVHKWKHWNTGDKKDFSIQDEADSILSHIKEEVCILAKSIGTLVAMFLLENIKVNKLVLCGLPFKNEAYSKLSNLKDQSIIVFQNVNDPLMSFEEVEKYIRKLNPKIKIVKKERNDHLYPFLNDFREFLLYKN